MILRIVPPYRPRRDLPGKPPATTPAPPAALTLVSATYDPAKSVELTFDRPIDVAGIDVTAILVDDGELMDFKYAGWPDPPPVLTGPATVLVDSQRRRGRRRPGRPPDGRRGTRHRGRRTTAGRGRASTGLPLPFP